MDAYHASLRFKQETDIAQTSLQAKNNANRYQKYADEDVPDEEIGLNAVTEASTALQNKDIKKAAVSLLLGYKLKSAQNESDPRQATNPDSPSQKDKSPKQVKSFTVNTSRPNTYIIHLKPNPLYTEQTPRLTAYKDLTNLDVASKLAAIYLQSGSVSTTSTKDRFQQQKQSMDEQVMFSIQPKEKAQCRICEEDYSASEMMAIANCNHQHCIYCIGTFIKTMVDSNRVLDLGCPNSDCQKIAVPELVSECLVRLKDYRLEIRYKRIRNSSLAVKWGKKICINEMCYAMLE